MHICELQPKVNRLYIKSNMYSFLHTDQTSTILQNKYLQLIYNMHLNTHEHILSVLIYTYILNSSATLILAPLGILSPGTDSEGIC